MMAWLRWKIAWWRWFWHEDWRIGDPSLGNTRDERNRNIDLLMNRKLMREPKRP